MANLGRSGDRASLDRDQVEPVAVPGVPEAEPPELGDSAKDGPFPEADRLLRPAESWGMPGFDLDKGDQAPPPRDQVQIVMSQSKAMGLDAPSAAEEVGHGRALAEIPPAMPRIAPLFDGLGVTGADHATG